MQRQGEAGASDEPQYQRDCRPPELFPSGLDVENLPAQLPHHWMGKAPHKLFTQPIHVRPECSGCYLVPANSPGTASSARKQWLQKLRSAPSVTDLSLTLRYTAVLSPDASHCSM